MRLLILLGVIIGFAALLVAVLRDPAPIEPEPAVAEPTGAAAPVAAPLTQRPSAPETETAFFERVAPRTPPVDNVWPVPRSSSRRQVIDLRDRD